MAQFMVRGKIIKFSKVAYNIKVDNTAELRDFWMVEGIVTKIDWSGDDPPLVTVSKQQLVAKCKPGDEVLYTIETRESSDGIRIRGVDLHVLHAANP